MNPSTPPDTHPASPPPFAVRGLVEGFYGVFYTSAERDSLLRFLGAHGYNLYVYGPKGDRWHRDRWREPYPADVLQRFAQTVAVAEAAGVQFCYAIAPGLTICYASEEEFQILTAKLHALYCLGVRAFSLFLDDIPPVFHCAADRARYGGYGEAHADLCNRVHGWLQALDAACSLSMVPTFYHGVAPFDPYLHELGARLDPAIDICYTGTEVCSPILTPDEVGAFAAAVGRPPLIWDNYPVNDVDMTPEMHIGPIRGRDDALAAVVRGILVNPMNQAEASKIPLLTVADFLAAPTAYDPDRSWEAALRKVGGTASLPALRCFAENSLHSCLGTPEAAPLQGHVEAALAALAQGESPSSSPAVAGLEAYLHELEDSSYFLKYRMANVALRNELLPWLDLLETWVWVGKHALSALRDAERGLPVAPALRRMQRFLHFAQQHPKRWAGHTLLPLAEYATRQDEGAGSA